MGFLDLIIISVFYLLIMYLKNKNRLDTWILKKYGKFILLVFFIKGIISVLFIGDFLPICYGDIKGSPYSCSSYIEKEEGYDIDHQNFLEQDLSLFYPLWFIKNSYSSYKRLSSHKFKSRVMDAREDYYQCKKDFSQCYNYIQVLVDRHHMSLGTDHFINSLYKDYYLNDDKEFCKTGFLLLTPGIRQVSKKEGIERYYKRLNIYSKRVAKLGCLNFYSEPFRRIVELDGVYILERHLREQHILNLPYDGKKKILDLLWRSQKNLVASKRPYLKKIKDDVRALYEEKCRQFGMLNCSKDWN